MAKEGGSMNVKLLPVSLEVDLKNAETPLKVQYVVELTTDTFSDVMSTGVTYMSDAAVVEAVRSLADLIASTMHRDLGLQTTNLAQKPETPKEEDL